MAKGQCKICSTNKNQFIKNNNELKEACYHPKQDTYTKRHPVTKNFKRVTGQMREFEFIFVIKDHQPIDWLLPSFFLHTFR